MISIYWCLSIKTYRLYHHLTNANISYMTNLISIRHCHYRLWASKYDLHTYSSYLFWVIIQQVNHTLRHNVFYNILLYIIKKKFRIRIIFFITFKMKLKYFMKEAHNRDQRNYPKMLTYLKYASYLVLDNRCCISGSKTQIRFIQFNECSVLFVWRTLMITAQS